jgi:putative FmdB family regulatory protein
MPTYQYRCQTCGDYEVVQRITESALTACQTCGNPIERLIAPAAFVLKGSGWYTTDYARKSAKGSNGESKNGESKSESSSESKTESKTESKSTGGGCGSGCGHTH